MNPVFVILVIGASILLWFLLSFAFKPLGKFLCRLWDDAYESMNKDNNKKKKEKEQNE